MAKANASENQNNRVVYSQANDVGQEEESKSLSYSIGRLEEENKNIAAALARLEQESAILRELFNNANNELNNLKKPSLLVADVVSVHGDKATIKMAGVSRLPTRKTKIKHLVGSDLMTYQLSPQGIMKSTLLRKVFVTLILSIPKPVTQLLP